MGACKSTPAKMATVKKVNDLASSNKVMVFSKTYCPYCKMAKEALSKYTNDFEVMEVRLAIPSCLFARL